MPWSFALALVGLFAGCAGGEDNGPAHDQDTDIQIDDATEKLSDAGLYYVAYTSEPAPIPYNDYFELTLMVYDGAQRDQPLADASVTLDAVMPEHGHGMNTDPVVTANGDGTFGVEGMLFHMQGYWQILIEVTDAAGVDTVAFEVDCCQG